MTFTILGTLPSTNDYTAACRSHKMVGAKMKQTAESIVAWQLPRTKIPGRVHVHFDWHEPNRRRDPDNVRFGAKFILDAMVERGVIDGDGWTHIAGLSDGFHIDKANPRIEVTIREA